MNNVFVLRARTPGKTPQEIVDSDRVLHEMSNLMSIALQGLPEDLPDHELCFVIRQRAHRIDALIRLPR